MRCRQRCARPVGQRQRRLLLLRRDEGKLLRARWIAILRVLYLAEHCGDFPCHRDGLAVFHSFIPEMCQQDLAKSLGTLTHVASKGGGKNMRRAPGTLQSLR